MLYFFPFDEQESSSLTISAVEGGRYIFTEQQNALLAEAVTAQRLDNDLNLRLYTDPQKPFDIVLKDFYLGDIGIYSLTSSGEYHQHLVARSDVAQGTVEWISTSLGHQQDQAESEFLTAIQRAATFEAIEQQLAVLNADVVAPVAQEDASLVGPRLMSVSALNEFTISPQITSVQDNVGGSTGEIELGSTQALPIIDDKLPVLKGIGEPNATLELLHNGVPVLTFKVDEEGNWSAQPSEGLGDGAQFFSVRDVATQDTSTVIGLVIDTIAPGRASITQITQDHTGTASTVANGGYTSDNTPSLVGKAEASTLVTIYRGNVEIGATIASATGNWSFSRFNPPLADGEYSFKVVAQDASGNTGLMSREYKITIDTVPPEKPQIVEALDDVGAVTGPLLSGGSTDDATPVLKGKAEAHSTVKIFDGASQIGSVTADANGNWTFTPAKPLAEGAHSFTATATDRAGLVSAPSAPLDLTVMLGLPAMPVITAVKDDVGSSQGILQQNAITDDARPTIEGTAAPRSTISIYSNGILLGTVMSDAAGLWSFTPETALADGLHTFTATATNAAGNVSLATAIHAITIDTMAPEKPSVGGVTDGQGPVASGESTDDTQPTLSGEGNPGDTVTIIDNGNVIGEVQIGEDGKWAFTPEAPLAEGEHVFEVVITDPVGNASEPSDEFVVIIDTIAPEKPSVGGVTDEQGPVASGESTDDTQPTLSGEGTPGNKVTIIDNGNVIGEVQIGEDGKWAFTPEAPLAEGEHVFEVVITDPAGNASEPSDEFVVIVDTVAPEKPSVGGVTDEQGPVASGESTDDTQPTLSGEGNPGDTVTIIDNGNVIGEVQIGEDGKWAFTPEAPLAEGEHVFEVVITDPAGNASEPSDEFVVIIDTVAPEKPSVGGVTDEQGPVASGESTDDTQPTLSGEGNPGDTVTIIDNGNVIGEVQIGEDGKWAFTPEAPLAEGEHVFEVVITDPAGNASEPSDEFVVIIDTVAPEKPSVGGMTGEQGPIESGDSTDDTQPTLSGEGNPGDTVTIIDNGNVIGEVQIGEDGKWAFTPEAPLAEGEHVFEVVITDPAGNASEPSDEFVVIIDTVAPEKPSVGGMTGEQGPIESGDSTDDTQPTLSGEGNPGDTVTIIDNGNVIGEVQIGEDGKWAFTPEAPLAEGEHVFEVVITDPAGNASAPSDEFVVIIDTIAPEKPSVGGMTGEQGPIESGDSTDDTQPTLSGEGNPGDTVTIIDNGNVIGEVQIGEDGKWEFTPEAPLAEGEHVFEVVITDPAGNASEPSDEFVVIVDTVAPEKPSVGGMTGEQGPIESGESTDDTQPTLSGEGNPGDTVTIIDNGNVIGEVQIGEDGKWEFTPEAPLAEGEHVFEVVITDPAGNASEPSEEFVVIIDTIAPEKPSVGGMTGEQGPIESGESTKDTQPTLSGEGNPGDTVTIIDNGNVIGEVQIGEDGKWEFTPEAPLAEGEHVFEVVITDPAGNASEPSEEFVVIIDTVAPEQPSVGGITDGNGPLENGDSTDNNQPTLSGEGNPGDTVTIIDNGNVIGEVQIGDDGKWEFTPEEPLEDGEHVLEVVITDPAGNASAPSEEVVIIVDTVAPTAPSIDSAYDDQGAKQGVVMSGEATDDTRPTLSGKAEANGKVVIFDKGVEIGRASVDATGNWSFTPDVALAEGEHSFTVVSEDQAGNASEPTAAYVVFIDIAPPLKPSIESVYDDQGAKQGNLISGDTTDDTRPTLSGKAEAGRTVVIENKGVEIGRVTADESGNWSFTPEAALADGDYRFSAVAVSQTGERSPVSDAIDLVIYTGNGPTQVARLLQMGKDSGHSGSDFITNNGTYGRLLQGVLNAELTEGQKLQVSSDGGKNWFDALVEGTDWVIQDRSAHTGGWVIQTRVVDQSGTVGYVMKQAVVMDTAAPRAPSSVQMAGTHLQVGFDSAFIAVGDRVAVIADGGERRFEHTLTQQDIAAGFVKLDVGSISSASAALVDKAGNSSGFINTDAAPAANTVLTGDVTEVYGQSRDNVFSLHDVSVLDQIHRVEGSGGVDSLRLLGANQVLDLSAVKGRLSSIEVIDLTGTGDNTVKLALGDVLELGNHRAFISDDCVQLAVKGNVGDKVLLSDLLPNGMDVGDWEALGSVTSAGVVYEVYQHTGLDAELLVQQGVMVQFQ
ncbi:Ig-like domain-containing protein [Pseudomonas sp. URMO17WK12:I11]|uniref:Ig-like domain-containing protein n=1 Tax=Pseudomonas sp. URMO17WK12:I11 TaxID=1283291 RepID=UPI00156199B6|nr:Ig-like domain-containing protein [Pseudomonas sp. URMO17WK12:I11]